MPGTTEERDIIIRIDADFDEAISRLGEYQDAIDELQKSNANYKKQLDQDVISRSDYNKAVAANRLEINRQREAMRMLERDIQSNVRQQRVYGDSIRETRQQVNDLTRSYDSMSRAERESARGTELLSKIKELRSELKTNVEETGRFQHNVGDYEGAIRRALAGNNSFVQSLLTMASAQETAGEGTEELGGQLAGIPGIANTAKGAINGIVTAVGNMTKALIKNPVVLIVVAVVAALAALKNALDSSEQSTQRLNAILAPFRRLLDGLLSVFQTLVGYVLDVVEAYGAMFMQLSRLAESLPIVGSLFKSMNDEIDRSVRLEQDRYALEIRTRDAQVTNAKYGLEVAKLRAASQERDKYTAEQRLIFIQEAAKRERAISEENVNIAKERLRIAEEEASRAENNAETENELARLKADVYIAETNHFNRMRELISQENTLRQETINAAKTQADQAKAADKEAANQAKQRLQRQRQAQQQEITLRRQYEDIILSLEKEGIERSRQEVNRESERRIEDLRRQLATTENLTAESQRIITQLIEVEERRRQQALDQLNIENLNKEAQKQQQLIQLRLASIKAETKEALDLRIQAIEVQRRTELAEAERLGIDLSLVNAKYDTQINNERVLANRSAAERLANDQRLQFQARIMEAQLNGQSETAIRLEQARLEQEQLTQMEGESDAAYLARQQILASQITGLQKDIANETLQLMDVQVSAYEEMFGALSEFIEEFADDNEALAAFSKALALFELGLNTARALSAGIAAAQSVPFPGNLAAIATTVATILANIAQARQVLNKSKEPKAKFAHGGLIRGAGSGTSDNVPIMASNGESVLTARSTSAFAPLLSSLNQMGGGVPIQSVNVSAQIYGEEMLTRSFAKALALLPAPRVAVDEIRQVDNRVSILVNEASV